jgi:HAD superfamily hydrolase (TIGR01509 family)
MKHHLNTKGFGVEIKPEDVDDHIKTMHLRKTAIFVQMIESGELPLRPGVKRLMKEVNDAGLVLGVCTTSNERSAKAVAYGVLKDIDFKFVLAGDVVSKKKPDPEIYNLALEKTGFAPDECVVSWPLMQLESTSSPRPIYTPKAKIFPIPISSSPPWETLTARRDSSSKGIKAWRMMVSLIWIS